MKSKVQSEYYDLFLDWKVNLSRGCDISAFSMVFYSIAEHGQTGHNKASSDIKLTYMIAAFSYKDFLHFVFRDSNTLFRGNSVATKSVDEFMKHAGMYYLHDTIKCLIDEVSSLLCLEN